MIEHRMRRNKNNEPVLVLEVTGEEDIFRFTNRLIELQVDMAEHGYKAIESQKRRLGSETYRKLHRLMFGDGQYK